MSIVGYGTNNDNHARGGSRIFERGVHLRSTSKKGGPRRGSNFGPNVKKPT